MRLIFYFVVLFWGFMLGGLVALQSVNNELDKALNLASKAAATINATDNRLIQCEARMELLERANGMKEFLDKKN